MSKNLKKKFQKLIVLFFVLTFTCACFTFRGFFFEKIAEYSLNWYVKPSSFIKFEIKKVQFGLDGAYLEGVSLKDEKNSFSFYADKVRLCLIENRHRIACQLNEASLVLDEHQIEHQENFDSKIAQHIDFSLSRGSLSLKNRAEKLEFSLNTSRELIEIKSLKKEGESFDSKIYLNGDEKSYLECKDVNLTKVLPFIKLVSKHVDAFEANNGVLNAHILASYKKGAFQVQKARTSVREIELKEVSKELVFKSRAITLNYLRNQQDFFLESDLKDANLSFMSNFHEARLAFNDLNGKLYYDSKDKRLFEISGKMHCLDQVQSILIRGEPKFCQHDLSCSLNLAIEGAQSQSGLSLHFGIKDNHHGFVLINFRDIDAPNLLSAKCFVNKKFKEIQSIECSNGLVSGSISLEFLKGRLLHLQFQKVKAKNLEIVDPSLQMRTFFHELDLDLFFDPSKCDLEKIRNLKLVASNANIECQLLDKKRAFLHSDIQLSIKNGRFESSFLKCTHENIASQVVFLGDITNFEMQGYFRAEFSRLLKMVNTATYVDCNQDSCLSFRAIYKNKDLDFSASLVLEQMEDQRLDFKAKSENFSILKPHTLEEFQVQSKCLSKPILDLFVQKVDPNLNLQGEFSFQLDHKKDKYYLTLEGNALRAQRDNLVLHSHTNVSGCKAIRTQSVFTKDFTLLDASFYADNLFVKNQISGLEIRQIKGQALFQKNCFNIDHVTCDVHGLSFAGHGMLRQASNGVFLKLIADDSIGSISQINALFSHIDSLKETQLPLDGQVIGNEGGVELNVLFEKQISFDYKLDLLCKHATMPLGQNHKLEDIHCSFAFDSKDERFQITDASALLKHNNLTKGYALQADAKWFLGQPIHVNVIGCMDDNEVLDFKMMFDPLKKSFLMKPDSHLMNVTIDQCEFNKESLFFRYPMSNYEFVGLLDIACNLNFISKQIFDRASSALVSSKMQTLFVLEGKSFEYKASLTGKDVSFVGEKIQDLAIEVQKKGDLLSITKFSVDDKKAAASLLFTKNALVLNELSYSDSKVSLLIDKGLFDYSNLMISFDHHLQIQDSSQMISRIDLRGASQFNLNQFDKGLSSTSQIELDVSTYESNFKSHTPLSWSIDPNFICLIEGFNGPLQLRKKVCLLEIKELQFSVFDAFKMQCTGFLSHKAGIQDIASDFGFDFDHALNLDPIESISFDFDVIDQTYKGQIYLDSYNIKNPYCPLELKHSRLIFEKNKVEFVSDCTLFNEKLKLMFQLQNKKDISLKLLKEDKCRAKIEGFISQDNGPMLTHLSTDLFGLSLTLSEQSKQEPHLKRFYLQTGIDCEQLKKRLTGSCRDLIDIFELDKGYFLNGEIVLFSNDLKKSFFEGQLKAKQCDLLGYKIDSFYSTLYVDQKNIIMQNFSCADKALSLNIPEISVARDKKSSLLKIPEFCIRNLRPSLLEKKNKKMGKVEPFIVQEFSLKDIQVQIGNSASLKGKGRIVFENHAPREHSLAQMPLEFISSLGLDRSLLVPVQGTMDCDLKGESLIFSNLKDSYSQGKRSIFFLSQKTPSYIDLKGNIHMSIKMKQNVLFKFTELFILSIRGTLDEPVFSLQ